MTKRDAGFFLRSMLSGESQRIVDYLASGAILSD